MSHNYPKITSPFKRTEEHGKTVNINVPFDDYAKMFIESNIRFTGSEKVDGTNLNIIYDGNHIQYRGHTDKTTWNPEVEEYIKSRFLTPEFEQMCEQKFGENEIQLSGELIGPKIQGNLYKLSEYKFILFDIYNITTDAWWNQSTVTEIAEYLNLERVKVISSHTIKEWLEQAFYNCESGCGYKSSLCDSTEIEGVVIRPEMELCKANGERVIYKLKVKDLLGRSPRYDLK